MPDVSATAAARARELAADPRTEVLAQKNYLIAELAGAIDNQFNNLMMAISSHAEVELKKVSASGKRGLEQVLRNTGQATYLIQKLLAFSRHRASSPQTLQLSELVGGLADLLKQLAGEQIEVIFTLEPSLKTIKADAVQIEQLLVSLVICAKTAIADDAKLSIVTRPAEIPDKCVMLSVSGFDPKALETAHNGSDHGFGVTLARAAIDRIVREANGVLKLTRQPNQGAAFEVYFPAIEEATSETQEIPEKSRPTARTILVVEDDDAVRVPAAEFLKMEGFKVLQAKTGPEAISIALQKRSPVDLLITDIVMPGMSGRKVAQELMEMFPGMQVLFMSGDVSGAGSPESHEASLNNLLQKPFRLDKLNEKIRDLLGE